MTASGTKSQMEVMVDESILYVDKIDDQVDLEQYIRQVSERDVSFTLKPSMFACEKPC